MQYRKKNRLEDYDYSQEGYYFVTICTKNREECFGKIDNGKIILNRIGNIVKERWLWLSEQYQYVKLDEYIIMPNHLHGIVIIDSSNIVKTVVGTGLDLSLQQKTKTLSLSNLIGAFKTTSSISIHESGFNDFQWQRSFYDHIIRNEKSLFNIQKYIQENPAKWELDRNNIENLYM